MTDRSRPLLAIAIVAILAAACAASSSPAPSPVATPVAVATPTPLAPAPSADPAAEPSGPVVDPTPAPSADSTPTPAPAVWSKARTVKGLTGCNDLVGTIDDSGTTHLAVSCGGSGKEIRYATSKDGINWTVTTFKAPSGRFDQGPELAFTGSTLTLAFTRVAPGGEGCGSDGLADVGVNVRTRSLPDGAWSATRRIGMAQDHLQNLRVDGSTIHAVVTNEGRSAGSFYERISGDTVSSRVRLGDVTVGIGLRLGDDGLPRLALDDVAGIRFGTLSGGKLTTRPIPGTAGGAGPVLALGPGNVAYVLWTISPGTGGCVDVGPGPKAGTYLSTNAGGTWSTTKLSKVVGAQSLTMDPATGEVDAVVGGFGSLQLFAKPAAGGWTHKTLTTDFASSAVVRRNPATGGLLVAFVHETLDGDDPSTVQVMTKG
jgi:hypothetical protein